MRVYDFQENAETGQVTCFIMQADPAEISAFKLKMAFSESEYKGLYVFNENIDPACSEAMAAIAERSRNNDDAASSSELPLASCLIAERRDGTAEVKISDDRMVADVTVTTACGGSPITAERIRDALTAAGINVGIQDASIDALVAEAIESPGGLQIKRKVAEGKEPGRGTPSRFEYLITPFQDRVLQPKELDDGSIDMLDLGDINTVETGQPLVRRHPAQPGEDGFDVLGTPIPSETPKETEFTIGNCTEISADDPHLLISTSNGIPHRIKNGMTIDDVLQIDEVGLRTGHIDLDGNLLVKGDIRPDMKVKVTGNLMVLGFVESAEIEAGGDVTVRNGIIGPPPDTASHSCAIVARNIEAKYAQNANLKASEDIRLSSHMLHCQASCHSVYVGTERTRDARLAGGSVQADNTVCASVFGAEAGTQTKIGFDARVQEMQARADEMNEARQEKEKTLVSLAATARKLLAIEKRSAEMNEKIQRIRNTVDQYQKDALEIKAQEEELHQQINTVREQCHVTAWFSFHGGVELHCGAIHHRFTNDRGPGTLAIRDGRWRSVNEYGVPEEGDAGNHA